MVAPKSLTDLETILGNADAAANSIEDGEHAAQASWACGCRAFGRRFDAMLAQWCPSHLRSEQPAASPLTLATVTSEC